MYYQQNNLKLMEAMNMELELEQSVREWLVPGLHISSSDIPSDAPSDAEAYITFVYKYPNSISYGAMWSSNDDVIRSISFPEEVSSFEELREKFPKLFELEGELLAFTL